MSRNKKHHNTSLVTDKDTDILNYYFMAEEKINDQLRNQIDERLENEVEKISRIRNKSLSEKNTVTQSTKKSDTKKSDTKKSGAEKSDTRNSDTRKKENNNIPKSETKKNLKNNTDDSSNNEDDSSVDDSEHIEFADSDTDEDGDDSDDNSSTDEAHIQNKVHDNKTDRGSKNKSDTKERRSSYLKHVDAQPKTPSKKTFLKQVEKKVHDEHHIVKNPKLLAETPEERRIRGREIYAKLHDLAEKHGIVLSRTYHIDDNPDEMEEEYKMHNDRAIKKAQVNWYKRILLTIISGVEFLNTSYDPFKLKLKNWSKQVATDMDDFTEILEELYEKYKDKGGKLAPEIRLVIAILLSAITYHISQTLFGMDGLGAVVKNNPNVFGKLIGGFMKGNNDTHEPPEATRGPPKAAEILTNVKKARDAKNSSQTNNDTENTTKSNIQVEQERKKYQEEINNLRKHIIQQEEMHRSELNRLHSNIEMKQASDRNKKYNTTGPNIYSAQSKGPVILSDNRQKPAFLNTNPNIIEAISDNIFEEVSDDAPLPSKMQSITKTATKSNVQSVKPSVKQPQKQELLKSESDDMFERLDSLTDMVGSRSVSQSDSTKKNNQNNIKNNEFRTPASKSVVKNTNGTTAKRNASTSDRIKTETRKNNNIIVLE